MYDEKCSSSCERIRQERVGFEAAERRHRLGQAHHLRGGLGSALLIGAGHELVLDRLTGRPLDGAVEVEDGALRQHMGKKKHRVALYS